jgi:hypothetical protein
MTCRLFYTDVPISLSAYMAQKPWLTTYKYDNLDDALGMAREIEARGGVAWEIELDDGPPMGREQIQKELRTRRAELADKPKVY